MIEFANRKNIGNMKGQMEEHLSNGGISLKKGNELIYLSGAEMDLKTAPVIRKCLLAFAENGLYGYTIQDHAYNHAVCRWMERTRSLKLAEEDVVVATGTVSAVNTAIKAFTMPEDGIVIQSPSYYRFDRAIRNQGRKIVYNPMIYENGTYRLDLEDLKHCCEKAENKMLLICNPHNPTGRVFTKEELADMVKIAQENNMIIFCDEIFGEMVLDAKAFYSLLTVSKQRIIVSTSLGKSFNFTGVNQANLLICDPAVKERFLQQQKKDHIGSIDPFFYNALCAAYTEDGFSWIRKVCTLVEKNDRLIREFCGRAMPLIRPVPLQGGFILWMDMHALGLDDAALQYFMEQEANVIGDPGREYGNCGKGFYRLQIAAPEEKIHCMLVQIKKAYDEGGFGV
ncbi:MAG: aminotransferase class I/II-fold pyridoxal phosphate-dependent enzyme [Eubacteriales bacterium]|nr:aminotransferase class I/II-fold pyridoxal phosphate-dependent enzyme [Eubacteriales bacterium]